MINLVTKALIKDLDKTEDFKGAHSMIFLEMFLAISLVEVQDLKANLEEVQT